MLVKTVKIIDDCDEDSEGGERDVVAPARWEICSRCSGDGHHSNPAIDGNGITSSEWGEWDPEERDDYMSGRYDVSCEECRSSGKVVVVDEVAFKEACPEDYAAWKKSSADDEEYQEMCDSEAKWERRMLYGSDY